VHDLRLEVSNLSAKLNVRAEPQQLTEMPYGFSGRRSASGETLERLRKQPHHFDAPRYAPHTARPYLLARCGETDNADPVSFSNESRGKFLY
jgi:hypothetical protein